MQVTFVNENVTVSVEKGMTILDSARKAGLWIESPCGGNGTCGKCTVTADGKEVRACCTKVEHDLTVQIPERKRTRILNEGTGVPVHPDGTDRYALAFDIGTTTVVCRLLSGTTGETLADSSMLNPQAVFGADVISRIDYALSHGVPELSSCIRNALRSLTLSVCEKQGISPLEITVAAVCGNTAMHHLFLGIDPRPLTVPPYMPAVREALELPAEGLLPVSPSGKVRMLPNIAGFVGADTVAAMNAVRFDGTEEPTILLDIGTNGEMVVGDGKRRVACSAAAGPAFEGAGITFGMRGMEGAVDHVSVEDGGIRFSVIGGGTPRGLCGSGILDLTAALLELSVIDGSGHMEEERYVLPGSDIYFSRQDVREVQLAKAAIRAGIELCLSVLGIRAEDVKKVLLAGAFGSFLDPASVIRIGMLPPVLSGRIIPVGNAAGEGARLCALSRKEFDRSVKLSAETEFLELASCPDFQDCFVDMLSFEEDE